LADIQLVFLYADQEEPIGAVQQFAGRDGITSPFLMDPKAEIDRLHQLRGTPTNFFIDHQGVV
jgi:hypothetical protein